MMGMDGGEIARQVEGCRVECEGGGVMRDGSANNVRTDTWQNCNTVFTHWQGERKGRLGGGGEGW